MESRKETPTDFESIARLRDELMVQAHLFKAEMKEEWQKLEKQWAQAHAEWTPVARAAEKSAIDVRAASHLLLKSLKRGYERIKSSLPQ